MTATVLVVEDEKDIQNLVRYNLEKEGLRVLVCDDGQTVLSLVIAQKPDLIVLDVMLPDRSGFDVCQDIKSDETLRSIPIIMLTARSSEQDRIRGLESGAEDYVVKPFSPRELVLRVKGLLERSQRVSIKAIEQGLFRLVPDEYRVFVEGQEVQLTQIEFKILHTLLQHPNVVRTREQLLDTVWVDNAEEVLDRAVDAHVKRMRSKLGQGRDAIETVRGLGYRFVNPSPVSQPNQPV